ncbi:MAG TPA: AraC family transcriptional regulator [Polyangiaceae bacterium]|nr:AraC family transcriptional regulator [Polyangiaceae bacterium]
MAPRIPRARARAPASPIWAAPPPPLPNWQALLTPVVAHAFDELQISVALWIAGEWWHPIHVVPNVIACEHEHGVEEQRFAYNHRSFAQVKSERRIVRGLHGGFVDLFVPVQDESGVRAIFVTGPIAVARPTSAEVLARWYLLSGTQGNISDPSFSQYLSSTLATLTLEGPLLAAFERLMSCFAGLVGGQGAPDFLAAQAEALRRELQLARSAERMWEVARSMVGERTAHTWTAAVQARQLDSFGLKQVPQHAVVGLLLGRENEPDPVDEVIRRDAFQRACVDLARKQGGMVCGQVGDHGVFFLVDHSSSSTRTRTRLTELASRAATIAGHFELKLHLGVGQASGSELLPAHYRSALWAAEKALSQADAIVYGEPRPERSSKLLRKLRLQLAESIADRPNLLLPRFDRYVEAVLVHAGYRLEPTRAHLEAGLERLVEPLLAGGTFDERSFDDLCAAMERSADDAQTVTALVATYRGLVTEIGRAMQSPTQARQGRGIRRALIFIGEHLAEPLNLAQVAGIAGFAPGYFSRLLKRSEGMTFDQYLQKRRLERAKQMLKNTALTIDGIRQLCGFPARNYFHRVFKRSVGMTPAEFRQQKH